MTRQKAIEAKCKDCIYDSLAGGTWRQQTEECAATECPLHPYRPVTQAKKKERAEARVQAMSEGDRLIFLEKQRQKTVKLRRKTDD